MQEVRAGTNANIIGVESNNANAQLEIKTSTINGTTNDLKRTLGNITICATDLYNKNADGNSFTLVPQGNSVILGVDNPRNATTYYLIPGLFNEASLTGNRSIQLYKKMILIGINIQYYGTDISPHTITFNIYNSSGTSIYTITINICKFIFI